MASIFDSSYCWSQCLPGRQRTHYLWYNKQWFVSLFKFLTFCARLSVISPFFFYLTSVSSLRQSMAKPKCRHVPWQFRHCQLWGLAGGCTVSLGYRLCACIQVQISLVHTFPHPINSRVDKDLTQNWQRDLFSSTVPKAPSHNNTYGQWWGPCSCRKGCNSLAF